MNNQFVDFGSLDSSLAPDLSLNSPARLSLQLETSDLSISLSDITSTSDIPLNFTQKPTQSTHPFHSNTNQLNHDFNRHPSKRWTSFSELGKKFKSFDHSTVHGTSSYHLKPNQNNNQLKTTSIYSTSSNHRNNLFKLFHPINSSNQQTQLINSSTLPILPPLSELFDGSTSFDKELYSSITHQPNTSEETKQTFQSLPNLNNHTLLNDFTQVSTTEIQSSLKQQENDIQINDSNIKIDSTSSSIQSTINSSRVSSQIETLKGNVESSPPMTILIIQEPNHQPTINQVILSQDSTNNQTKVDNTNDEQVTNTIQVPSLNQSDELKLNHQDSTTCQILNSNSIQKNQRESEFDSNQDILAGKKKKLNQTSGFFKLLFLKGLGHLKSSTHSSSVPNDTSKALVTTTTIHDH